MRKLARTAVILIVLTSFAIPAGAGAAQTTIGQLAPLNSALACSGPSLFLQSALGSGPSYAAPGPGAVTSWSTTAAAGAGRTLTLKVLRPFSGGSFQVVGHDGPRTLVPGRVNTFETGIPVEANDILALNTESSDPALIGACTFFGGVGDVLAEAPGSPVDGAQFITGGNTINGFRLNVSATLASSPSLTALSPASGPIKGGSAVKIVGSEFAAVQKVTFDGVPAASFKVDSESQITAIAPAGKTASQVPVVITTAAGRASAPFTYFHTAPTITAIGPSSGSVTGGSAVTIAGSEFAEVKSVTFGGIAATTFSVEDSERQIIATAPAAKALAIVPVLVTTPAGSATATFTYAGCLVPKLRGSKLGSAKKKLKKAGCKVGKVKKRAGAGKSAPVVRQSPKPKKVLAPGTKVNLTL
jgi:hypothetical protein